MSSLIRLLNPLKNRAEIHDAQLDGLVTQSSVHCSSRPEVGIKNTHLAILITSKAVNDNNFSKTCYHSLLRVGLAKILSGSLQPLGNSDTSTMT